MRATSMGHPIRWQSVRIAFVLAMLPAVAVPQTQPAPAAPPPAAAPAAPAAAPASKEQLEQLLSPIALYPDSLLSQVLMAATYPADVADAAKWSKANKDQKGDAAVKMVQDQPWEIGRASCRGRGEREVGEGCEKEREMR